MISPSELLHTVVIDFIISISRHNEEEIESCQEFGLNDPSIFGYKILCYLSKAISYQGHITYNSIKDFQFKWISILKETNFLFYMIEKALKVIESIDSFIDFCENLKTYFDPNTNGITPNLSDNELSCPHKISPNSSFGVFLRKMIANWTMTMFPEQCSIFEKFKFFLTNTEQLNQYQCNTLQDQEITQYLLYRHTVIRKNSSKESHLPQPPSHTLHHFIQEMDVSLQQKNFTQAEDIIHDYFDGVLNHQSSSVMLFSPDPSTATTNKDKDKEKSANNQLNVNANAHLEGNPAALTNFKQNSQLRYIIEKQFKELSHQSTMNHYSILKHQHSMISLAMVWMKAKNYRNAQLAIEEALKTAHQRGDHPTVIKCLLLLYEIYEKTCANVKSFHASGSVGGASSLSSMTSASLLNTMTNPDELLRRCIEKSGNLLLQDIFNQSVLKFLDHKINNLTSPLDYEGGEDHGNSTSSSSPSGEWTVAQLFNLLSFATYNETSLTVKYCLFKTSAHLEDTMTAGPNPATNPAAAAANNRLNNNNNSTIEKLNLNDKYYQQYLKITYLTNSLWTHYTFNNNKNNNNSNNKLGLSNFLILLNLHRIIQLYGKHYNYITFTQLFSKYLITLTAVLLDTIQVERNEGKKREVLKVLVNIYQVCEVFNKRYKRLSFHEKYEDISLSLITSSSSLPSTLDCTLDYLLVLIAYLKNNRHQCLALLDKLLKSLEVSQNIQTLQSRGNDHGNEFYEKDVFNNDLYSFEETVRVFLLYKVVYGNLTGGNEAVNIFYLQRLCDYYQLNYLIENDAIVKFFVSTL